MQPILRHLFKKESLQEVPLETLQQMTLDFPYFAVAQYLLTRKLQQTSEPAFEEQFQKTLVYFHNPLWLQYKLSEQIAELNTEINSNGQQESADLIINEPLEETQELSHDMFEDVLLHQENDYSNIEIRTDSPEMPSEEKPAALISGSKEPQTQTIQREEPFTFQAYYTVDYFASQGIKLGHDHLQQDKLGKQLKSFTEWLKTMRRLPETSVVEILDKINDGEIAQIAAHSLDEKEVITEAMAEVLVKQGKIEKAKVLYHKLILQNPHKSTYFATKLEDLKQL